VVDDDKQKLSRIKQMISQFPTENQGFLSRLMKLLNKLCYNKKASLSHLSLLFGPLLSKEEQHPSVIKVTEVLILFANEIFSEKIEISPKVIAEARRNSRAARSSVDLRQLSPHLYYVECKQKGNLSPLFTPENLQQYQGFMETESDNNIIYDVSINEEALNNFRKME
jgi:hypothetical protein